MSQLHRRLPLVVDLPISPIQPPDMSHSDEQGERDLKSGTKMPSQAQPNKPKEENLTEGIEVLLVDDDTVGH